MRAAAASSLSLRKPSHFEAVAVLHSHSPFQWSSTKLSAKIQHSQLFWSFDSRQRSMCKMRWLSKNTPNQEQQENEHSQLPGLLLFSEFNSRAISPQFSAVFLWSSQVPSWCSSPSVTHDDSAPHWTGINTRRKKGTVHSDWKKPKGNQMIFVCEVKEGFCPLLSTWEMHLENALFWAKTPKSNKLLPTPATTRLTSQRESRMLRALQ